MADFLQLKPELLTLGAALLVIVLDLLAPRGDRRWLGWVSGALAAALIAVLALEWTSLGRPVHLWHGVVVVDRLGLMFKVIFLLGVTVVSIGSAEFAADRFRNAGEYYALLFFSALGLMLMASSGDLLTLYLGIELATLSLYVLVAFAKDRPRSGEAGLKYIILGATASAVYIYGVSLIYGSAGTTRFATLFLNLLQSPAASPGLLAGGLLVLAALAFKIAAVPFHMWAPDAYQGAPTPVAAFLSVASKASGFAVILRLVFALHGSLDLVYAGWSKYLAVLAIASMVFGVLVGAVQKDVRRLLAYSSIAHAGFVLLGIVADTALGYTSVLVYLGLYAVMNVGAFGAVAAIGHVTGRYDLESYAGLGRRHPLLAAALAIFMLALAGIPPLAGFFAKFYVLAALIDRGYVFLAVVAIAASVVALFLYARVLKPMYFQKGEGQDLRPVSAAAAVALVLCFLGTLVLGIWPHPLVEWAKAAVVPLLPPI